MVSDDFLASIPAGWLLIAPDLLSLDSLARLFSYYGRLHLGGSHPFVIANHLTTVMTTVNLNGKDHPVPVLPKTTVPQKFYRG